MTLYFLIQFFFFLCTYSSKPVSILTYPLIIFNIENDILIGTEPYYHYITEHFFYKYISNGQCDYSILDTNYISFHCNTMIQYIIDEDFPHLEMERPYLLQEMTYSLKITMKLYFLLLSFIERFQYKMNGLLVYLSY